MVERKSSIKLGTVEVVGEHLLHSSNGKIVDLYTGKPYSTNPELLDIGNIYKKCVQDDVIYMLEDGVYLLALFKEVILHIEIQDTVYLACIKIEGKQWQEEPPINVVLIKCLIEWANNSGKTIEHIENILNQCIKFVEIIQFISCRSISFTVEMEYLDTDNKFRVVVYTTNNIKTIEVDDGLNITFTSQVNNKD